MPELQYPLCRQTVTLYHADPAAAAVTRRVVHGVLLDTRRRAAQSAAGVEGANAFLLIIPQAAARFGQDYALAPLDRLVEGEGPTLDYAAWPGFTPAAVPGLCVVQYVDPKTLGGVPCHVEAGGYWSRSGTGAHSLTG